MKPVFSLVASILALSAFTVNSARAQAPIISSFQINEHFSQISIHGTFGSSTPTVTVDTTSLKVLAYSDTLIRCAIPKNGNGSAGDIRVLTANGLSNSRRISAISIPVDYDYGGYNSPVGKNGQTSGASSAHVIYPLSFRGDLSMIWRQGYNFDPVGDSITGSFGADMSSYDVSNGTQSNIHQYFAQGGISAYPVPIADQNPSDVQVYALLDYRDSSLRVSVARVSYFGKYTSQYMATPQSQPDISSGTVSGTASPFTLYYKILPDFSLNLSRIDSETYFYIDPQIGTPTSKTSYIDAQGAHISPAPLPTAATVRTFIHSETPVFYPNPAHGIVRVNAPYSKIELFDALGRAVLTSCSGQLDISTLDDGMYFYHIECDHSEASGNLIVRR